MLPAGYEDRPKILQNAERHKDKPGSIKVLHTVCNLTFFFYYSH